MSINYNNENTIIFTIARMNPPTPGHLFLIEKLIVEAISKNVERIYIFLSKSNSDDENPVPCPDKIPILGDSDSDDGVTKTMINSLKMRMIAETHDSEIKEKIHRIRVIIRCVPEGAGTFTPLIMTVSEMSHIHDLNLFLIIGDDRKDMLDSITGYFYKLDNVQSITGVTLPREEMSEYKEISKDPTRLASLDISKVPINAMSASFVRNIVRYGLKDKFDELYSQYLDKDKIDKLYGIILHGLALPPLDNKKDEQGKPLKYTYPMIKGYSVFPISSAKRKRGGKKRTRNNKKREKKSKTKKTRRNIYK